MFALKIYVRIGPHNKLIITIKRTMTFKVNKFMDCFTLNRCCKPNPHFLNNFYPTSFFLDVRIC